MKIYAALGMFLLLIGQLTAEQSVEVQEREEQEVESPLHNLVKRSTPKNYGYKATGKVKVGAPVVLKSPVFKQLTTYVQDGFKYTFPNRGGNVRGGNFRGGNVRGANFRGGNFKGGNFGGGNFRGGNFDGRAGGHPYGYFPNGYQYQGGYPYGYYYGYPSYFPNGYYYGQGGQAFSSGSQRGSKPYGTQAGY